MCVLKSPRRGLSMKKILGRNSISTLRYRPREIEKVKISKIFEKIEKKNFSIFSKIFEKSIRMDFFLHQDQKSTNFEKIF
jgi:hypothetical protein